MLALSAVLAVLLAPAAAAKMGAMFSPQLIVLIPGQPTNIHLWVMPEYDNSGHQVLAAPRAGSRPVVSLRSRQTGEVVNFLGTGLPPNEGGQPSTVRITLPVRRTVQTWDATVHADGKTYRDEMGGPVTVAQAPAPPAGGTAGSPPAHRGAAGSLPAHRTAAGGAGGSPPAWPFALAGLLAAITGGALLLRRYRRGHDPSVAPTRSVG
jgi:hypothetical protein